VAVKEVVAGSSDGNAQVVLQGKPSIINSHTACISLHHHQTIFAK
jgi:hypothetical protein